METLWFTIIALMLTTYVVLDGLKSGDRIVIEGAQSLVDGATVTEAAPAPAGKSSS